MRLDQEEPVEIIRRDAFADVVEHVPSRHDIEYGEPFHPVAVVERHAMADPSAPVMPDDREAIEAQRRHDLNLIRRHGAF